MQKQMRKITVTITAAALAFGVMAAGPVPVYGSAGSPKNGAEKRASVTPAGTMETEVSIPLGAGRQGVKSELTGTVEVSLISVTMPADGFEFQVNPEAPFHAVTDPGGQIMCPDPSMLRVTNNSVVPVRVEISEVPELAEEDIFFSDKFPGGAEQSFRLVEKVSEASQTGTAILVLGKAGQRYASESDFEQYAIFPGKTGIRVADLEAGESAGLQLYGKAAADFYGEYQFTVRPMLKISAVRAG